MDKERKTKLIKTETETRQKQSDQKQPTKQIELQKEEKKPIEFDLSFNQSHIICKSNVF